MQLFVTSADPMECARYLDDRRMIKAAREGPQVFGIVTNSPTYERVGNHRNRKN